MNGPLAPGPLDARPQRVKTAYFKFGVPVPEKQGPAVKARSPRGALVNAASPSKRARKDDQRGQKQDRSPAVTGGGASTEGEATVGPSVVSLPVTEQSARAAGGLKNAPGAPQPKPPSAPVGLPQNSAPKKNSAAPAPKSAQVERPGEAVRPAPTKVLAAEVIVENILSALPLTALDQRAAVADAALGVLNSFSLPAIKKLGKRDLEDLCARACLTRKRPKLGGVKALKAFLVETKIAVDLKLAVGSGSGAPPAAGDQDDDDGDGEGGGGSDEEGEDACFVAREGTASERVQRLIALQEAAGDRAYVKMKKRVEGKGLVAAPRGSFCESVSPILSALSREHKLDFLDAVHHRLSLEDELASTLKIGEKFKPFGKKDPANVAIYDLVDKIVVETDQSADGALPSLLSLAADFCPRFEKLSLSKKPRTLLFCHLTEFAELQISFGYLPSRRAHFV